MTTKFYKSPCDLPSNPKRKTCEGCEHVGIEQIATMKLAYCKLTQSVVPQTTETGQPIEYIRIAGDCPIYQVKP